MKSRPPARRDARALIQELFRRYARLLEEWPEIVEAACELRDRGEGALLVP